ncbi:MAG: outer membrane beta-barrel protein [Thermodesulfobacteriota bacterium]
MKSVATLFFMNAGRYMVGVLLSAVLLVCTFSAPLPALGEDGGGSGYKLGEGIKLWNTGLRLGGYVILEYEDAKHEEAYFKLDDLSFFVFGDISKRWTFFSEIEDEDPVKVPMKGKSTSHENWQIERLYADYLYSDNLTVRVGKFLTPVGTWNEIHAAPLVWTTSRPAVTFAPFPEFITGVQLLGEFTAGDEEFSYSATFQNNESINERTGYRRTHIYYGGRIRWLASPRLEIGVPAAYYVEYEVDDKVYLTGLDLTWKGRSMEVRGEATYGHVKLYRGGHSREYGYYLQGVYDITEKLSLIGRHEYMRARDDAGDYKAFTFGAAYKPRPPIVFKIEYQTRSGSLELEEDEGVEDDRFLASFSILL